MLTVVTYLWEDPTRDNRGYKCNEHHVVTLQNMVHRHLTVPHRFVCVTDKPQMFNGLGVKTVPLPMNTHVPGTVYARLIQHCEQWAREELGAERILSMDVDVCITGNLDKVASREEDIVLWRNPNYTRWGQRAFYQSSIQLFTPGARPCLFDHFDPRIDPLWINNAHGFGGREQAWISEKLSWDEAYFDESWGIYGAGRLGGSGVYTELPDNACFVSFPGARAPWQPEIQEKHKWLKEHYK